MRVVWMSALLLCVVGCSSAPEVAQEQEVPRIVLGGPDGKSRIWTNVQAFRPVPLQLRPKATEICDAIGARPGGFHPRALDEHGRTFTEGGFYCVKD